MASSTYKDNEDFALAIAKRTGVTKILLKERGEYDSCSIVCMFSRENLEVAHRAISAAVTLIKQMNPACELDISEDYTKSTLKNAYGTAEGSAIAIRDTSFDDTISDNYGTEVYISIADTPALGIVVITVALEGE